MDLPNTNAEVSFEQKYGLQVEEDTCDISRKAMKQEHTTLYWSHLLAPSIVCVEDTSWILL